MTKIANFKRNDAIHNLGVLVIEILNFEFVCNLMLVIWDLNYFGACDLVFATNCTNTDFKIPNEPKFGL